ncbi:MAG: hypothetical protein HRT72_04640 [Flavobacteriales bacterium]|nr:hypothetical protein [Flavobacteriales bacterium]
MVDIEPHYAWRNIYVSSKDEKSPLFERDYSELDLENKIYDHFIHPQWDHIGSTTLYIKIIFVDYDTQFACIELIGEWNDCINNDIMHFKRNILDDLMFHGINKFALIGENILNFHASDDSYYEEWKEEIEDGWIAIVNFQNHVLREFESENILDYFNWNEDLNFVAWRTYNPEQLQAVLSNLLEIPHWIS